MEAPLSLIHILLEKYCEKQGWEVVAVYQDDGFTGLNMERPDLQRMLRAIERRQINLVITKDLSRLGRNYLQTGHLIEDFFPRNGVRYICLLYTSPCAAKAAIPCGLAVRKQHKMLFAASKFEGE